jgi:hypothetical protein
MEAMALSANHVSAGKCGAAWKAEHLRSSSAHRMTLCKFRDAFRTCGLRQQCWRWPCLALRPNCCAAAALLPMSFGYRTHTNSYIATCL